MPPTRRSRRRSGITEIETVTRSDTRVRRDTITRSALAQNTSIQSGRQGSIWLPKDQSLHRLYWNKRCRTCNIRLLSSERVSSSFCCGPRGSHGQNYQSLPRLPREYLEFIHSHDVSKLSRKLNLTFSFASLETTMEFPNNNGGSSFVAIQGRSYHRVRPRHSSSAIRWILFDGFETAHIPFPTNSSQIPNMWITALKRSLSRVNPFVKSLITFASQIPHAPNLHLELAENGVTPEVAAIIRFDNTSLREIAPRTIVIQQNVDQRPQQVSTTSSLWEPLVYPLLFPHGTRGWQSQQCKFTFIS
jgi:hypothetical protein